jgi:hypothetical protein
MSTLIEKPHKVAIFPLFHFGVSEDLARKINKGFEFSNKVKLRLISKDEISFFREIPPGMWHEAAYLILGINKDTFVFEVEGVHDINQADHLTYEVQLAIRLQNRGTVFYKPFWLRENSKTIMVGCTNPPTPWEPKTYKLSISELEEIDNWVGRINKRDLEKNISLRVACERFSRSCEERRPDDKIIDLAVGFEALFAGDDASRIGYMGKFVGLGCSMLLGQSEEERKKISKLLEKTFSLRNDIVHTNKMQTKFEVNGRKYILHDFIIQIQEYLRNSLKKLL